MTKALWKTKMIEAMDVQMSLQEPIRRVNYKTEKDLDKGVESREYVSFSPS